MSKLSLKQKKFIYEYVKTLSIEKAIKNSGYPKNKIDYFSELLNNPDVMSEIHNILAKQARTLNVSKSYIVEKLLKIIEFSIEEEAVLDKDNVPTGKYKLKDASNGLKALITLAKYVDSNEKILSDENINFTIENLDIDKI